MAVKTIKIVSGNTAPAQLLTLERAGVVLDVTGATVSLIIKKVGGNITNTGHQTCTLIAPATGLVQYSPQAGDFGDGTASENFTCEVKIVYAGGTVEYLYDFVKFKTRARLS